MTLNSRRSPSWLNKAARSLTRGLTGAAALLAAGSLTAGCLRRPVTPATPQTTNVYINQIRQTGVDKIDLLFMIDNSISMADKQQILAEAVPVLVQRLIQPTCVDADGNTGMQGANGNCQNGFAPEFKPIKNIHIGVLTSSLGDHGSGDVCSEAQNQDNIAQGYAASFYNDLGQLMPSIRPSGNPTTGQPLVSWNNTGFLVWDPRVQADVLPSDRHANLTANETDPTAFVQAFTNHVTAADQHGCGYEASLEAWYRFLVDPEPVATMGHTTDTAVSVRPATGNPPVTTVNQVVIQQRTNFLRHDSLLAVIMLSDENDCSIIDENDTQGWLVGYKGGVNAPVAWRMPRATGACMNNPNDPKVCHPCSDGDPDPECAKGNFLSSNEDSMNMRCFNQLKRFGIDLLYPTQRYVDALREQKIRPRFGGPEVPNYVFTTGAVGEVPRDKGLVFLAGLVGVPWQDVSTEDSWPTGNNRVLKYLRASELRNTNPSRWDVILGTNGVPTDPHMIEQIDPRPAGTPHPLLPNITIAPDTATGTPNAINGHEQTTLSIRDDLQFACIFPLGTPVPCTDANADACDCNYDDAGRHSPLCQGTTDTTDGTQVNAKAYPGVRELQVLKDFGDNAIVASICPKNTTAAGGNTPQAKAQDPNYGYNPAVAAIVDRLKEVLTVKCLPRPLSLGVDCTGKSPEEIEDAFCVEPGQEGKVPCAVIEVRPQEMTGCGVCADQKGRVALPSDGKIEKAAKEYLRNTGYCAGAECDSFCYCELNQFTDDQHASNNPAGDLTACKTVATDPGDILFGYCYVDPAAAAAAGEDPAVVQGEEQLVKDCKSSEKRILRFLGEGLPAKDGLAFIACIGAAASQ
jgi:hypothetical protein